MNGPEETTPPTDEEMRAAFQQIMRTPIRLPVVQNVVALVGDGGEPGVLVESMTPAGTQRLVLTRDEALALASRIRKVAQTGPELLTPPGAGRLVVPGR